MVGTILCLLVDGEDNLRLVADREDNLCLLAGSEDNNKFARGN